MARLHDDGPRSPGWLITETRLRGFVGGPGHHWRGARVGISSSLDRGGDVCRSLVAMAALGEGLY